MNSGVSISWFCELEKGISSPWAVGPSLAKWQIFMGLGRFIFPVPPHWFLPLHFPLLNPLPRHFFLIYYLPFIFYSLLPGAFFPPYKSTPNLLVNKQASNKYTNRKINSTIKNIKESELHFLLIFACITEKSPDSTSMNNTNFIISPPSGAFLSCLFLSSNGWQIWPYFTPAIEYQFLVNLSG